LTVSGPRAAALAVLLAPLFLSAAPQGTLYGHFPYDEAPAAALAEAGKYRATGRVVQMRAEAAEAFRAMVTAADADGVHIVPISGFRSKAYQEGLWTRAIARRGSEKGAAKWVAPPGHSEHHTGWALDLGDGDAPKTDIETSFDKTKASDWLKANAVRFHFELSFPRDNPQGVSYEPWHWRYVGNDDARRLFHPADR
jgi:D-alanyl-D-alanine carboxypeptidase